MMRILITRRLGYIGGRLAQCLCNFGFEVILATRNAAQYLGWAPTAVVKQISWDNSDDLFQLC